MTTRNFPSWQDASCAVVDELIAAANAGDIERTDELLDLLRDMSEIDAEDERHEGALLQRVRDRLVAVLNHHQLSELGLSRH